MTAPSPISQIAVVGLGYVGLPLAVALGREQPTIGFDIRRERIEELKAGNDYTLEVESSELKRASHLRFTCELEDIKKCTCFIVTVPTPIDSAKRPDFSPLIKASETIATVLKAGDLVIYESTVYPGATEEVCVPILEKISGLSFNENFYVGYSPERINPGDKEHRLENTVKVTSGSTPAAAKIVDDLYKRIIGAGTFLASSIKVAEAAKVIENTQRDLNIALVNELALIFSRMEISTEEVLKAAGTKWNFLPFRPGLVGGHCIGVDPYYLTHKAQEIGYHPEVILAGRRINDGMGAFVANKVVRRMTQSQISLVNSKVLVLGLTFKENCPDVRNTRVVDIIDELKQWHVGVDVFDPWVDAHEAESEYGIRPMTDMKEIPAETYDAVIVAVAHRQFKELGSGAIRGFGKPGAILFDVKYLFPTGETDGRL